MYRFSRAIYRELADEIIEDPYAGSHVNHERVLRACESAIERLATDRHYFAHPSRTLFNDIRVARRLYFGERINMDLMADIFNIANRYNVSAVSPLFTNAGQATAAYDPRQFQFAMKVNW